MYYLFMFIYYGRIFTCLYIFTFIYLDWGKDEKGKGRKKVNKIKK